ncbi:hypothetical protein BV25DRAFT_1922336 [Artomyces pyxidatus]|uniref:Uncharacterized protein n=1 Tax=Artomyces pyxidatus TaxID=48021 RepID=A0ACB8SER5_9AGAM|nr:hypothetical protein BV25DRAFT_1922336 [Artomyces pyxidatus]
MSTQDDDSHGQVFWSNIIRDRRDRLSVLCSPATRGQDAGTAIDIRCRLQDELDAIQLAVSTFSAEINGLINLLPPISHLPSEIISRMLLFHASNDHPDVDARPSSRFRKASAGRRWIEATHVCRRWRQIALNTPNLWSHVFLARGATLASAMVARARTKPLVFTLNLQATRAHSTERELQVKKLLHRTQGLFVSGQSNEQDSSGAQRLNTGESFLSSPAPLLEYAVLGSSWTQLEWLCEENLFGHDAPRLQNRAAYQCRWVPWTSPSLRNLVSLKVENRCAYRVSTILQRIPPKAFDELAAGLAGLQALEILVLVNALPEAAAAPDAPPRVPAPIIAPVHLRKLFLLDRCAQVALLLKYMRIPPRACVSVLGNVDGREEEIDAPRLLASLEDARIVGPHLAQPWTDVRYSADYWGHLELGAFLPVDLAAGNDLSFKTSGHCNRLPLGKRDPLPLIKATHQHITSAHLVHLCVDVNVRKSALSAEMWHDILGNANELRTLHVSGYKTISTFLSALGSRPYGATDVFLPRLASLGVDIPSEKDFDFDDSPRLYEQLLSAVKTRSEGSAAIPALFVSNYTDGAWTSEQLVQLQEHVSRVQVYDKGKNVLWVTPDWDGVREDEFWIG